MSTGPIPNIGWPEWIWRGLMEGWCKPAGGVTVTASLEGRGRDKCLRPVDRTLRFDNSPIKGAIRAYAVIRTRCRACEVCIRVRRTDWATRAMHEVRSAERTWFATLTFNPATRAAILEDAISRAGSPSNWSMTSRRGKQDLLRLAAQRYLTLFMKRLRKAASKRGPGVRLRYMAVFEAHKDGTPHAHVLIHEYGGGTREREIRRSWGEFGFAEGHLAKGDSPSHIAWYCVKYLTKDTHRVRASIRYGVDRPAVENELTPVSVDLNHERAAERAQARVAGGAQAPLASSAESVERQGIYRRWRFNAAMYYAPELAKAGREARAACSAAYVQGLRLLDGIGDSVDEQREIGSMALSKPKISGRRGVQSRRTTSGRVLGYFRQTFQTPGVYGDSPEKIPVWRSDTANPSNGGTAGADDESPPY